MGISKNKAKLIRSLADKKNRDEQGLFLVEGEKITSELISSIYTIETLFVTPKWMSEKNVKGDRIKEVIIVEDAELARISNLSTPNQALAIVRKEKMEIDTIALRSGLSLMLDDIQDPGNLGTILRIADWFGIRDVICSENTADTYNPKVIQSSMGAFLRVRSYHVPLEGVLKNLAAPGFNIYGALLNGKNMYQEKLSSAGLIIMGNESKGIQEKLLKYINCPIFIPGFPPGQQGAESLNVGVATGIICSEFRRRML